jgi:hypothetical protein
MALQQLKTKPMNHLLSNLLFVALLLCVEYSCSFTNPQDIVVNSIDTEKRITPEELPYYTFAKQLEESINKGTPDFLNEHFEVSLVLAKLIREIGLPKNVANDFLYDFQNDIDVGAQIVVSLEGTGSYELLSIRGLPDKPSALFRLIVNEELNYHEVFLTPAQSADLVRVNDFCIYKGGLTFYETLKTVLLSTLKEEQIQELDTNRLSASELAMIEYAPMLDELTIAVQKQDYGQALRLLKRLPEALKTDKMTTLLRLNIGYHLKSELLAEALSDFRTAYPKNAVADFTLLNLAIAQKNNPDVLQYADAFGELIPDKCYLNIVKAKAYENQGDFENAEALLKEALTIEPGNLGAYKHLAGLLLEEERYEDLMTLFAALKNHTDEVPENFLTDEKSKSFFSSEIYQNRERLTEDEKPSLEP